ncbi:MAG: hypothetical protein PHW69_02720 [Elusimicrobiaceae bacterium]|nr:hypothetical protein [Elusimicrobiaceae bacterium]
MKRLLLLALITLCPAAGAEYDTSGVAQYTISLAKRMGLHDEIMKMAHRNKVSTAAFTGFYTRVALKNIQLLNLQYYMVTKDIEASPVNAFEYYRLRTETEPANADNWAFRAMAEESFVPGYAAIRSYSKALELDRNGGNYGYLYYRRGRLYEYLGEPEKAEADLTASLGEVSGNPLAHLERARARYDLADYAGCAQDLSAFFRYEPQSRLRQSESMGFLCEAVRHHGHQAQGCGDPAAFRAAFEKNENPAISTAVKSASGTPEEKTIGLASSTNPVKLLAADRIITAAETAPQTLFLRGYVKFLLAKQRVYLYADALPDLERCAETAGAPVLKSWALALLSDIYGRYGDLRQSIQLLGQAVFLNPAEPRFYLARAAARIMTDPASAASDLSVFFKLAGPELAETGAASRVCRQFMENRLEMPGCRTAREFAETDPALDKTPEPPVRDFVK